MTNQELSALIAEEVSKAVAPLYDQLAGNIPPKEEETKQEPEEKEEETPDFTSTAKRLRAKGLIK